MFSKTKKEIIFRMDRTLDFRFRRNPIFLSYYIIVENSFSIFWKYISNSVNDPILILNAIWISKNVSLLWRGHPKMSDINWFDNYDWSDHREQDFNSENTDESDQSKATWMRMESKARILQLKALESCNFC